MLQPMNLLRAAGIWQRSPHISFGDQSGAHWLTGKLLAEDLHTSAVREDAVQPNVSVEEAHASRVCVCGVCVCVSLSLSLSLCVCVVVVVVGVCVCLALSLSLCVCVWWWWWWWGVGVGGLLLITTILRPTRITIRYRLEVGRSPLQCCDIVLNAKLDESTRQRQLWQSSQHVSTSRRHIATYYQ